MALTLDQIMQLRSTQPDQQAQLLAEMQTPPPSQAPQAAAQSAPVNKEYRMPQADADILTKNVPVEGALTPLQSDPNSPMAMNPGKYYNANPTPEPPQLPEPSGLQKGLVGVASLFGSDQSAQAPTKNIDALRNEMQQPFLKQQAFNEETKLKDPQSDISKRHQDGLIKMFHLNENSEEAKSIRQMSSAELKSTGVLDSLQLFARLGAKKEAAAAKASATANKPNTADENWHYKNVVDATQRVEGLKNAARQSPVGTPINRSMNASDGLRLIKMAKDGKIKANPSFESELATTMAATLGTNGQMAHAFIESFKTKTGKSDLAGIAQYVTANPTTSVSKEILNNYEAQLQGQQGFWEETRDNNIMGQWELAKPSFEKYPKYKTAFENSVKRTFPGFDLSRFQENGRQSVEAANAPTREAAHTGGLTPKRDRVSGKIGLWDTSSGTPTFVRWQ
jgi:hypothetical protein